MEKIKSEKVNSLDIEELACAITGLDYDEIDGDLCIIEDKLVDDFGCDFDQFSMIIQRLLPLIEISESPLTKKIYKGFADRQKKIWIIKSEIKS